jgi:hypothetical protein
MKRSLQKLLLSAGIAMGITGCDLGGGSDGGSAPATTTPTQTISVNVQQVPYTSPAPASTYVLRAARSGVLSAYAAAPVTSTTQPISFNVTTDKVPSSKNIVYDGVTYNIPTNTENVVIVDAVLENGVSKNVTANATLGTATASKTIAVEFTPEVQVVTQPVAGYEADNATSTFRVIDDNLDTSKIQYRYSGTDAWTDATVVASGNEYTATFARPTYGAGLADAGQLEVRAVATDLGGLQKILAASTTDVWANEATAQAMLNAFSQAKVTNNVWQLYESDYNLTTSLGFAPSLSNVDIFSQKKNAFDSYVLDYNTEGENTIQKKTDFEVIPDNHYYEIPIGTKSEIEGTLLTLFPNAG